MKGIPLYIALIFLTLPPAASCGELGLNIFGLSYHYTTSHYRDENRDEQEYNEINTGIGLQYIFNEDDSKILSVETGLFEDSEDRSAFYTAIGYRHKIIWDNLSAGVGIGFFDTETYYSAIVPMPVASVRFKIITLNFLWFPRVQGLNDVGGVATFATLHLGKTDQKGDSMKNK